MTVKGLSVLCEHYSMYLYKPMMCHSVRLRKVYICVAKDYL